jgi:beta-lactamase regulating signal transducer with metallopeptidase domain
MTSTNVEQFVLFSREVSLGLLLWSCQSALLLGVAWGGLKMDRSRSARTRCRIWLMALVMVAVLPVLNHLAPSLHLSANSVARLPLERIAPAPVPQAIPAPPEFHWASLVYPLLFAIWIVGVLVALWRWFQSYEELHHVRSRARLASTADLDSLGFRESGSSLDGARIGLSDELHSPGLAGIFRPWILFPADIVAWTTREERTSILHHELAHIQQRDHLVVLLQQALRTILFFHPLLRYACTQLDMERELACDDHVLDRGAERRVYAESILNVAQRCLHGSRLSPANLFASKHDLERRIDMILDSNRIQPPRQWLFLLPPTALLLAVTWLVVPASGQRPVSSTQTTSNNSQALPAVKAVAQTGSVPVVYKSTIWIEVVKRAPMMFQVRGLGVLAAGPDGRLHAEIKFPASLARDVAVGEPGNIAIPEATPTVNGKVIAIRRDASSDMVVADVSLDTALPHGAAAGTTVYGVVDLGILFSVLQVGRPAAAAENSAGEIFRLDEDGQTATRVRVMFGKSSPQSIEIVEGLKVGDRIILSDMEKFAGFDRIKLE